MLYILRSEASEGARSLSEAINLNSRKINNIQQPHFGAGIRGGDILISWGEHVPRLPEGVRSLNNVPVRNKFEDAVKIKQEGVPTIEVSRTRPQAQVVPPQVDPAILVYNDAMEMAADFLETEFARNVPFRDGVTDLASRFERLRQALNVAVPVAPAQPIGEWLGRRLNHVGGNDLLRTLTNPEFYVKKEDLIEEYRIHSFLGKSIRAGKKVPREGVTQHIFVRSYDGGWKIQYDGFSSTRAMRELAHRAVSSLGLNFGAVDIAKKRDNSLVVLEVNRAPGLEGGTVEAYARAIENWVNGATTPEV